MIILCGLRVMIINCRILWRLVLRVGFLRRRLVFMIRMFMLSLVLLCIGVIRRVVVVIRFLSVRLLRRVGRRRCVVILRMMLCLRLVLRLSRLMIVLMRRC